MPIPKILHYVWLSEHPNDNPSAFNLACRDQAISLHPGWEIKEWRDAELLKHESLDEVRGPLEMAWEKYNGIPTARSDLFRLCALYAGGGGIYLDYDVWCVRPLDWFTSKDLLLAANSFQPFVVGEHVIGAQARSEKILQVIKHFCHVGPLEDSGDYSPQLAMFVWYYGWEAMLPDVFNPHLRGAKGEDIYRTADITHAIHCYSRQDYSVERLKAISVEPPKDGFREAPVPLKVADPLLS